MPLRRFLSNKKIQHIVVPPLVGGFIMVVFLAGFNFQHISAKFNYLRAEGTRSSQQTQPQPGVNLPASDTRPRVAISRLGVDAPVLYEAKTENDAEFQQLLERGVVHYPFTALPGEPGNVVLFGHSSNSWLDHGNYKSIFSTLDKLQNGDQIDVFYQGIRYSYSVKRQRIVSPYDVAVLQPTTANQLTLITCYPVGSPANRLIVVADQVVSR